MHAAPSNETTIRDLASRVKMTWLLRSVVRMHVKNQTGQLPNWPDDDRRWRRAVAELRVAGKIDGDAYQEFTHPDVGDDPQ